MTASRFLRFAFAVFFFALAIPATAHAACINPAGDETKIIFNTTSKQFQYCDGTNWIAMHPPASGSGGCSNPAGIEGSIVYNSTHSVPQGCAGNEWRAMGPIGGGTAIKWKQVSPGGEHGCGIKADGTLWCWGVGSNGQLGIGAGVGAIVAFAPRQEITAANDWAQVSAGSTHTCAVKTNGTLWCWGADFSEQLGNGGLSGNQFSPVQEATASTNWVQVSSGSNDSCAVRSNGTLWCWGFEDSQEFGDSAGWGSRSIPVQESTFGTNWAQVDIGIFHTCAVRTNGTLWCWGSDSSGELGNGATTGTQVNPGQEDTAATDWVHVSVNSGHTCAVKTNGTLWCWGIDFDGQLGNGATSGNQSSPVQEATAATDWVQISAGSGYSCARKSSGAGWCWGDNISGHLGLGNTTDQDTPVMISGADNWNDIATCANTSCYFTCGIKSEGSLWCWGRVGLSNLASGDSTFNASPTLVSDTGPWSQVSAGGINSFSCAVKTNGTLWCWGFDGSGQLGNGALSGNQYSPTQESSLDTDWSMVSAGSEYACAVKTNGTLWCWGNDGTGQLGNGATTGNQTSPVQESSAATDWKQVDAGDHTCAVKTNGTLWCWGKDSDGQLGNGTTTGTQTSPVQEITAGTDWSQVTAGTSFSGHSCAVKTNGTLWCWGEDSFGQLGNGAVTGDQASPVQEVTAASDWAQVDASNFHTCAVKTNGTLWCWGNDGTGQLGNGATTGNQISPVQEATAAADWAEVSTGGSFTCAVKIDDSLWCWGAGGFIGIGDFVASDSPVAVTQGAPWGGLSAGYENSCAITGNQALACWGNNSRGAIGNGVNSEFKSVPVQAQCSNPTAIEGTMTFNTLSKHMQYCDGIGWSRIGR